MAILSPDAAGEWYLHLVVSSIHVKVGVTEPELSFPCSHGEYLVDLQRTSPEGSSPGNGSQEQGGKGAASFSLSLAALEPALRLLRASASRHHTDGPLAGILVRVQGRQVVFVASDGRRLWSSSFGAEAEGEGDFILRPKAFSPRDLLEPS